MRVYHDGCSPQILGSAGQNLGPQGYIHFVLTFGVAKFTFCLDMSSDMTHDACVSRGVFEYHRRDDACVSVLLAILCCKVQLRTIHM